PETEQSEPEADVVEDLSDEIIESPNDPNLYIKRALEYQKRKLFELALKDVDRALSIDPTVSYFHAVKGEIYFMQGNLRDARLNLEKAVRYDETNTEALLKLGEVNFLLRRYDNAIETLDQALKVNENLAQAYFIKGFVFKELGDTTLSFSSFQTATEVNPEHYDAYIQLGNLSAQQGNPIAMEYLQTALEIKPNSAEALYNLGMFYQAGNKFDKAMEVYQRLIRADGQNFLGYYNTGYIHLTEFLEFEIAEAYFDSVLQVKPEYVDALYNKGLCAEEMGETDRAVSIYRSVMEQDPQNDAAARGLSRLLD
ncbi:MAG: tetratricopeptide repeat protein, partial [Cryomorphaceae bacterium]